MCESDKPSVDAGLEGNESEEVRISNAGSDPKIISGDVGEVADRSFFAKTIPHEDAAHLKTFLQRESKRVARNPCTYLWSAMVITIALSAVGLIVGGFTIEVENEGWWSRGTLQSDRQRQMNIAVKNRINLAYNRSAWDLLTDPNLDHTSYETLLYSTPFIPDEYRGSNGFEEPEQQEELPGSRRTMQELIQKKVDEDEERRRLDQNEPSNVLTGCDLGFYSELSGGNLWPVWMIPKKEYKKNRSILDADVLEAICIAEGNTQSFLEENDLCDKEFRGCDSGKCIPPYSVVLYARLLVDGALEATSDGEFAMDCKGLSDSWTPTLQEYVQATWIQNIKDLKNLLSPGVGDGGEKAEPEYPFGYYPALMQSDFDTNGGRSQYTSTIFDTASVANATILYEFVDNFDRAKDSKIVLGAYDDAYQTMNEIKTDTLIGADMTLALGSAGVIAVAIMLHTQSLLITGLGLLQIMLSFPMAYFVYNMILGYTYFPFLNFIGVFVVFALGAGDIYVAFDKWTNCRKNNKTKSTEFVAAYVLPESLYAMFLTTITTALAFFATAINPVAPIKMFAIFCGLLILLDYVLVVFFIFPGLCIYDQALIKRAAGKPVSGFWMGCVGCGTCFARCSLTSLYDGVAVTKSENVKGDTVESAAVTEEEEPDDTINYNATQRFMVKLSDWLLRFRWPLLAVSAVAFGISCYFAVQLGLPDSSDVRLLKPSIQYEQAHIWRQFILSSDLENLSGTSTSMIWGLEPDDNGDINNPYDGTSLVLDETFDPSSAQAQVYLRDICDDLYKEDFAWVPQENFVCAINEFDQWLKDEYETDEPDPIYTANCGNPNGLPVVSDKFHACMSEWALKAGNFNVLSKDGIVKYIRVPFRNEAVFTDSFPILEVQREAIEDWVSASNEDAPEGIKKSFFSSATMHWHDTNGSIQRSAYSGAGISLAASSVIIFLSCQSLMLTVFTTATILFILVSVTALLTAFGWTLGFLESICFSILIGVSVDFVIHFTHAYVHHKGNKSREERTKYAITTMGPSILATAYTTFFSAIVMLFCTITFFRKFALVLFFTVVMATFASFVVFCTLTNCFGPTNPTYMVDKCLSLCSRGDKGVPSDAGNDLRLTAEKAEKVNSLDE